MREWPVSEPITGIAACCECAADGHTAAPATSVMNSRRLIVAPRGQNHAPHRLTAVWVLEWGKGDANCDQLFWSGNVGSGSHDRVKTGKAQNQQMLSGLPPKADFPILELLPPPALGERRHCGLTRRLVAVDRRAVLMVPAGRSPNRFRTIRVCPKALPPVCGRLSVR